MARKNYSEEFRRQAVDLYESTPGATVRGIADDLGIVRGTLRHWLEAYGTGKKTAADGTLTSSPLQSKNSSKSPSAPEGETPEQKIARLEARVNELEVETTKLTTEREILQRAAKYFAGESRPVAGRSSSGWSATTPGAVTPGAATCPRPPTRPAGPLRCQPLRNHTPCPRSGGRAHLLARSEYSADNRVLDLVVHRLRQAACSGRGVPSRRPPCE